MNNRGGGEILFTVTDEAGLRFLEGAPGQQLMRTVDDATRVVEACLSQRVDCALLHATNLTDGFFDLSSGEAGAVLQRLRNYGIRCAVVCRPGAVPFSSRFGEMLAEENRGGHFRVCESREAARAWLRESYGNSDTP